MGLHAAFAPPLARRWTAWASIFGATVLACLVAVVALSELASEGFEADLERGQAEHARAQAQLAAEALRGAPVGASPEADAALADRLERLRVAGELEALTLLPSVAPPAPVPEADEEDAPRVSAEAPLPGRPEWSVRAVVSRQPLLAADRLEATLNTASGAVLLLSIGLGAALAAAVTRPLRRLTRSLRAARPGQPPESVELGGPRELWQLGEAARSLLAAVQERDHRLQQAHERELRQLSALSAAVAHEVRNPLNALGLAVGRLERAEGDDAARLRGRLRASLDEIDRIVERFLDLSRPPTPVLQRLALGALRDPLAEAAAAEGLQLQLPEAWPTRDTDPALLLQALRDLLRNAAEAGARAVTLRWADDENNVLIIEDNGPGVRAEMVERLFEWFETDRAGGTGLGLPSARRAMLSLGGDLTLHSAHPAAFRLRLGPGGPP